jgi:hypothetical protein
MQDDAFLEQARRWRLKAEEYHTVADEMRSPVARASYRGMAETYDRMADHYERLAATPQNDRALAPAELREESRRCREAARKASDIELKRSLASRALALALLAEQVERQEAARQAG